MYAKIDIETGRLIPAPSSLRIEQTFPPEEEGGEEIVSLQNVGNPTPEQYAAQGWLPVTEAPRPDDGEGYHYEPAYNEDNGEIVQSWERVEDDPPEPTLEDGLRILLGGE